MTEPAYIPVPGAYASTCHQPGDLYTLHAAQMFGIPPEEVTKEQRQLAKQDLLATMYQIKP